MEQAKQRAAVGWQLSLSGEEEKGIQCIEKVHVHMIGTSL